MSQGVQNDTGFKSFTATGTAIAQGVAVKFNSSGLILASGATDTTTIGWTMSPIAANGIGPVKLRSAPGTQLVTAAAAITAAAPIALAANGQVTGDLSTGSPTALNMIVLEAATAQGDIIEATSLT